MIARAFKLPRVSCCHHFVLVVMVVLARLCCCHHFVVVMVVLARLWFFSVEVSIGHMRTSLLDNFQVVNGS